MYFKKSFALLLCLLTLLPARVWATDDYQFDLLRTPDLQKPNPTWADFSKVISEKTQNEEYKGIAYLISGGLVTIGSQVGYVNSKDAFAKTVYSVAGSLGIASMGYGTYLYSIGDGSRQFYNIIENTPSLTPEQKQQILKSYLQEQQRVKNKARLISVITFGVISALNLYNATQAQEATTRTALYFISGVNAVAAISIAF